MVSVQRETQSKGRHPLLKIGSLSLRIFTYLKGHPDSTITQIADVLLEEYPSVNGSIQRMKLAGLLIGVPEQKGNRTITVYRAVTENETGSPRDKVEFQVEVFVNDFGEYSVVAKALNQMPTAREDNPRLIHRAEFYVAVPKPTEPLKTRDVVDAEFVDVPRNPFSWEGSSNTVAECYRAPHPEQAGRFGCLLCDRSWDYDPGRCVRVQVPALLEDHTKKS